MIVATFTREEAEELYSMYIRHKDQPNWKSKLFSRAIKWILQHSKPTNLP